MKKRARILLFVLSIMFVLVGWGKKEVRLLDSSKLIDLEEAIDHAKPGGMSGNSEEESETVSENTSSDDDEETEGENQAEQQTEHDSLDEVYKNIVIRINEEEIFYTCGTINTDRLSASQLEDRIRSDYTSGTQVTLMDDFAESHVYKSVQEVLDMLRSDIGLIYKEELWEESD